MTGHRFDLALEPDFYRHERYVRSGGDESESLQLRAYYALKPAMPRRLQLALRRLYARRQARRPFPRWPIEPLLVERLHQDLRARLPEHDERGVPLVGFWPGGHRFAAVLTHDVEGDAGVANIERVRAVERRHGVVSCWNLCAEEYAIPDGTFARLRDEGCEIGLHGVNHQCKTFVTRQAFEADLPTIHRYLREWDVVGFRSPALHRNADWMPELGCLYDSSYPDTDPYEPQPGGCCSIFPFLNGELVELPLTLVQDHTMWEILRRDDIALWTDKADWIAANHGLVNINVHPDYVLDDELLARYDRFLAHLRGMEGGWLALPRDVAAWWRARETACVVARDGGHAVAGAAPWDARLTYARDVGGRITFSDAT